MIKTIIALVNRISRQLRNSVSCDNSSNESYLYYSHGNKRLICFRSSISLINKLYSCVKISNLHSTTDT